jgi:PqqD family protein of HPr-rel-A system
MADPRPERRWRTGSPQDLAWAEFGADYVVYHKPSGKTHLLNAASAALLRRVLREPKDARAAADELAAEEGAVGDAGFLAAVAAALAQLEHLGLIERHHA